MLQQASEKQLAMLRDIFPPPTDEEAQEAGGHHGGGGGVFDEDDSDEDDDDGASARRAKRRHTSGSDGGPGRQGTAGGAGGGGGMQGLADHGRGATAHGARGSGRTGSDTAASGGGRPLGGDIEARGRPGEGGHRRTPQPHGGNPDQVPYQQQQQAGGGGGGGGAAAPMVHTMGSGAGATLPHRAAAVIARPFSAAEQRHQQHGQGQGQHHDQGQGQQQMQGDPAAPSLVFGFGMGLGLPEPILHLAAAALVPGTGLPLPGAANGTAAGAVGAGGAPGGGDARGAEEQSRARQARAREEDEREQGQYPRYLDQDGGDGAAERRAFVRQRVGGGDGPGQLVGQHGTWVDGVLQDDDDVVMLPSLGEVAAGAGRGEAGGPGVAGGLPSPLPTTSPDVAAAAAAAGGRHRRRSLSPTAGEAAAAAAAPNGRLRSATPGLDELRKSGEKVSTPAPGRFGELLGSLMNYLSAGEALSAPARARWLQNKGAAMHWFLKQAISTPCRGFYDASYSVGFADYGSECTVYLCVLSIHAWCIHVWSQFHDQPRASLSPQLTNPTLPLPSPLRPGYPRPPPDDIPSVPGHH